MRRTILPPVLLCASAFVADAAQFRAGDFGLPWRSTDGTASGMPGFDPLARCDYPADASDAGAWDGDPGIVRFRGVDAIGRPLDIEFPGMSPDNVEVLVTLDSSRHAELSWNDGESAQRLLLPPCTNLALTSSSRRRKTPRCRSRPPPARRGSGARAYAPSGGRGAAWTGRAAA